MIILVLLHFSSYFKPCYKIKNSIFTIVIPKKNGKLRICIDFRKLNTTTKKDPHPLPFINEMLNTITWYEAYSFLDGYLGYHQIFIALEKRYNIAFVINWGAFMWKVMSFGI